jgi:D-alanyl-D-alanine carboxypeptidase/D-alanyl-D-alanine-endopeptidase (penicillin-binding protein 4)
MATCLAVTASACAQATARSATPATAATLTTPSLAAQIAALVTGPDVARDHWGIMVTALDGTPIYALNEAQLFQPDSNAKLFTTAAAVALLGPDYHLTTKVVATGDLDSHGVLHGDLKLVGGGDANFGAHDLPYKKPSDRPKSPQPPVPTIADIEELADKVVAKGLREVDGDVVGDDSHFSWEPYPTGWALDDLLWGYGAPVSALTIHDNQVEITVTPGAAGGTAGVSVTPDAAYYTIAGRVGTMQFEGGCDARLLFTRDAGSKVLRVTGDIGPGAPPCEENIAIEDPAQYAALALKSALQRRGVQVTGSARANHWDPERLPGTPKDAPSGEFLQWFFRQPHPNIECVAQRIAGPGPKPAEILLATHQSPPLLEDVTYTNKVSQNLHAELLVRDLGAALTCEPDVPQSLNVVKQWLIHAGLDPNDFLFYDGSGLSGHDLVTPRATAKLLSYAAHDPKTGAPQPWFADWKASLPVGGVDGSLDFRFTKPPLKGHVFAKTGTHSEGRALSGYLDCASGRTVIFSILVNNHLPGSNVDRDAMDKIVAAIAAAQ